MSPAADVERRDALVERIFGSTIATLEMFSIYLGWRLSLYEKIASLGPVTSDELGAAAGVHPRYSREWCEQQAVAGYLEVATSGSDAPRFTLPSDYREIFLDPESPAHVAPFAPMLAGIGGALNKVVDAYRSGGGVDYSNYGLDFRDGQGGINRPAFVNEMRAWLTASTFIGERLESGPPARIADLGCGQGFSTLAIARSFPKVLVDGIDVDTPSIEDAVRLAGESDVADRVNFYSLDATDMKERGPYDLVCIFEALHDMSRPVEALIAAREALGPDGSVFIADERVAEEFGAPGDEVERIMYGWSVVHCLPVAMSEQPSEALGTVLRPSTVEDLAARAGFAGCDDLAIENDFFRFYRLTR